MKKFLCLALLLCVMGVLPLGLAGCGGGGTVTSQPDSGPPPDEDPAALTETEVPR